MGGNRVVEVDCSSKRAPAFSRDEENFARLFVRGDERAEKIRWNAATASANARGSPGDRLA